jgi:class 3 adenylate cyclase
MARFARDCNVSMKEVTRKLELTLGPDTGDLRMRSGLHSGPVTAGVLRGERSRFQLYVYTWRGLWCSVCFRVDHVSHPHLYLRSFLLPLTLK